MKKISAILLTVIMIISGLAPSTRVEAASKSKETKYKKYVLCMDNYSISFTSSTGYIAKKDHAWYVPVEQTAKGLGYSVKKTKSNKTITLTKGKDKIVIESGKKYITMNGKKKPLSKASYMQDGKKLVVHTDVFKHLGIWYKYYSEASGKKKGYSSGVMVVSTKGVVKSLPKKQMHSAAATLDAARTSTQIVMVEQVSKTVANVSYHEKVKGQWKKIYEGKGYLAKRGIGKTKEWDYKTPKGTYNLGQAFGIKSNPGTKLDYIKVNQYHYSVDDHKYPKYYNTLVDVRNLGVKKVEGEHIIDYGKLYNYGIWINYNTEQKLGKGSSIFLHCTGKNKYTAGCVAIPEKMLVNILKRLNPGAKIVIF